MQLKDYNSLKMHQKAVMLGNVSVFLESYIDDDINCSLYAHKHFYIEVVWDAATDNLIEIVAFQNGDRLDKYLEKIILNELI